MTTTNPAAPTTPAQAEASADLSAAILALPLPEPVSMVASSADGFFSRDQVRALLESAASLVRATPPDLAAELRENAARYEWLRAQHWESSPLCVVCDPKDAVKLGRTCPSGEYLDMEIDALRAKGGAA